MGWGVVGFGGAVGLFWGVVVVLALARVLVAVAVGLGLLCVLVDYSYMGAWLEVYGCGAG